MRERGATTAGNHPGAFRSLLKRAPNRPRTAITNPDPQITLIPSTTSRPHLAAAKLTPSYNEAV
jgi:hypothetical protein